MAEFVMKKLVYDAGLENCFQIASAATSREALGGDIHPGTKAKLEEEKIPYTHRHAVQFTCDDYKKYDYIIGMDKENIYRLRQIIGVDTEEKVHLLLSFTGSSNEVADPWYTGNFTQAYEDITRGCKALLCFIAENNKTINNIIMNKKESRK
ncbi:protein-tyrosine phosphatase [Pectinatus cerevisiiphilus]|uniref:protein-tyrosine-phosphatase n=2 Tax=Pectinatus cerevisiiphilus TaxID=86956 RepID=A0A4R3K2U9_9FIRM|nr:protein-tyrosine phosphatase [Pectinatus cerevisiiphilus]